MLARHSSSSSSSSSSSFSSSSPSSFSPSSSSPYPFLTSVSLSTTLQRFSLPGIEPQDVVGSSKDLLVLWSRKNPQVLTCVRLYGLVILKQEKKRKETQFLDDRGCSWTLLEFVSAVVLFSQKTQTIISTQKLLLWKKKFKQLKQKTFGASLRTCSQVFCIDQQMTFGHALGFVVWMNLPFSYLQKMNFSECDITPNGQFVCFAQYQEHHGTSVKSVSRRRWKSQGRLRATYEEKCHTRFEDNWCLGNDGIYSVFWDPLKGITIPQIHDRVFENQGAVSVTVWKSKRGERHPIFLHKNGTQLLVTQECSSYFRWKSDRKLKNSCVHDYVK